MLSRSIARLFESGLFRDTVKLVSGTLGGRIILLLVLPIVTRLYEPDEFKLLAVFMALVSTISVVACLRFEVAIPIAESDEDAVNLLALAIGFAAIISLAFFGLSALADQSLARWFGAPAIASYFWLVAAGIFATGCYAALQSWATRARQFSIIARTRISQAAVGAATMLCLGWLGLAPLGLLLGNMLSASAGSCAMARQLWRNNQYTIQLVSRTRMIGILYRYKRYPIYSTPEALFNVAGMQIPIFLIAAYSGDDAGQLFLAMQVMSAPLSLLGTSVGQVYASRAANELLNGTLFQFTFSMMKRLFMIGIGPMLIAAFLSPILFPIVFGAEWLRSGVIVAWIAPWMLFQLVASPVSLGLHFAGQIGVAMLLQLAGLIMRVGAVIGGIVLWDLGAVEAYAVSGAVFYVVYGCVILHFVRTKLTDTNETTNRNL
jgi:O-antigen/teichoic acid export membrane protein